MSSWVIIECQSGIPERVLIPGCQNSEGAMAAFEIRVNGQHRFIGEQVGAITLSADSVADGATERVYLHVGIGEAGEYDVQYLGGDLRPGDEISIKIVADHDELTDPSRGPDSCSFCGLNKFDIESLVAGPQVAICDGCIQAFHAVIAKGAPLPLEASIQEGVDAQCNFCHKSPPEVPGLLVRNASAICPECLHVCVDLTEDSWREAQP